MRVLLIKMSSLGDVVHALPAVTDATANIPDIEFDWVAEEAFAEIPAWHPSVGTVIPVALRRWRKSLSSSRTLSEIRAFRKQLRSRDYDLILDAQGLFKSAVVSSMARGRTCGLDRKSAREPIASFFYRQKINVPRKQHAISRVRELFAKCFNYDTPHTAINYGIDKTPWLSTEPIKPYVVFLHGTTWVTKLWPESYWRELCNIAGEHGYAVHLPWGNTEERERASRIAAELTNVRILDRLSLAEMAGELANASAVFGVDSGLTHIASALDIPVIAIYGATDPDRTGALGPKVTTMASKFNCAPCLLKACKFDVSQENVFPPCYEEISPTIIWNSLTHRLTDSAGIS